MPYRSLLLTVLLLVAGTALAAAQDATPLMRHPAVSPDGSEVAFSYQGDLWTVPADGGRAYRLTVHEAYEAHPQWSPDGTQIAFTSDRFGNDDLFVMDAAGSTPMQRTHHSTDDALSGWTPDGRLLFTTERTWQQAEWDEEIYHVPATGGTPDRLLDAFGYAPVLSPDGRFLAFVRGANRTSKKGYTGPANKNVWVYDTEQETYAQITAFDANDYHPQWGGDRTLYFISEQDGTYNLYRQPITDQGGRDGAPEQVTTYDGDGVRYFSVSRDGSTIAFERQTDVYVHDVASGQTERLDVTVPSDYRFDPVEQKTFTSELRDYAVSPDGDQTALVIRGELFLMENDTDASRTVRLTRHAYRDRDVAWLSDSTLVFASDREGGQYDLYRLESADPEHTDLFDALQHRVVRLTDTPEDERILSVAPDRSRLALRRGSLSGYGGGQLVTAAVEDGALGDEAVLIHSWSVPNAVAWSPDSQWLAYSRDDLDFNEEVYIHAADGSSEAVNVSQHPKGDDDPVWSADGSKLGFISGRSSGDADVWFVWLREEDWERTEEDWQARDEDQDDKSKKGDDGDEEDEDEDEPVEVEIDVEDIHERLERVTALPGNEAEVAISEDGETFFFVAGRSGRTGRYDTEVDLYSVKWDGTEQKRLTEGGLSPYGVRLGPDGQTLFFVHSGGRLATVGTSDGSVKQLPYAAKMEVDHQKEREQVFQELWRALDQGFYDPNFHGDDWDALREKYRPWALEASTMRDFQDMVNLMLGELNASHMGFYTGDRAETQETRTGLLGVELDPVENGVAVQRVVPRSPADREASTLRVGDVITAVNGTSVAEAGNFYELLSGTVDEMVLLSVTDADGTARSVRIRPTGSLDDALYREWVEDREALVDAYSDGRLGYVHVEGMNWPSFERFERELYASAHGKEGLLIDVRFNGGGWTTDYLMAVLNVKRHAYTVPRGATDDLEQHHEQFRAHYPFGERLPLASWTKPVAALANQNSYSNAEIFSHAFKNIGHGPLIGQPTFGAVISTGGVRMINGSFVRMPFRGWYVYQTDQNMELGPAVPDVLVENPPATKAEGEDPQLRRAVETLLQQIDRNATTSPPDEAE
jgi:tricorn protease